ncbi:WXG100-like domain-containing protein, partial [Streptomyces nigra]
MGWFLFCRFFGGGCVVGVEVPGELNWLVLVTAGQDWPRSDEDGLRVLAVLWGDVAAEVGVVAGGLDPLAGRVLEGLAGDAGEQFGRFMRGLRNNVPAVVGAAGDLGVLARSVAAEVEYAKYVILAELVWLAVEIARAVSAAVVSGGASLAVVPGLVAGVRASVKAVLLRLARAVAVEAVQETLLDVAVQGLQM